MDQLYDEDLSNNKYFKKLRNDHKILLETAAMEKWVIVIPRSQTIQLGEHSNSEFVLSHIFIPNEEMPGYNFTSLMGDSYERRDQILLGRNNERRQILFEEIFYTKEFFKLRLWCISFPLNNQNSNLADLKSINTTEEASHFLIKETGSPAVLKLLGNICSNFRQQNLSKSIDDFKMSIMKLHEKCMRVILSRKSLRIKFTADSYMLINLKVSISLWVSFQLYDFIFEFVTNINSDKSELFNKAMQNMSDLSVNELTISTEHIPTLNAVKSQLSKIGSYRTPIGKLQCLRKSIDKIGDHSRLIVDDLIPIIVFAIVKSGYGFWISTIEYIKTFLDLFENLGNGYENFVLTTFEAAIYFITSGRNSHSFLNKPKQISMQTAVYSSKEQFLKYLFETIELNNEENALKLFNWHPDEFEIFDKALDGKNIFAKASAHIENTFSLCHPLCNCISCQETVAKHSININSSDEYGRTALHVAATMGFPRIISILISLGASVSYRDNEGSTPLHYAAKNGHHNVLLLLLHSNQDIINAITKDSISALYMASLHGHIGCVKAILFFADHMRINHNINAQDLNGNTALHVSCKYSFIEITECLLEYGADATLKNKLGSSPLNVSHNNKIKELLKKYLPETDCIESNFERIRDIRAEKIFNAIKNRDIKLLEFYLDGNEENMQNKLSQTYGKISTSRQKYLDFLNSLENDEGLNPLQYAALLNSTDIIGILIENGARVNAQNKNGETALHVACKRRNLQSVSILLQLANVNFVDLQDKMGNTALHYAVRAGAYEITNLILQHFPDVEIRNKDNMQPLDIARKHMLLNVAVLLEQTL